MREGGIIKNTGSFIGIIVGIVTLLSILFGIYNHFENRYAIKKEIDRQMRLLEKRLDIKIKSDYLKEMQKKIWDLEDIIEDNPNDETAKKQLKRLEFEITLFKNETNVAKNFVSM